MSDPNNATAELRIIQKDSDAPLAPLIGKVVSVLGYGNQGQAHAQNLRDSGVSVRVGSEPGTRGHALAKSAGFDVLSTAEAVKNSDLVIVALPDEIHGKIWTSAIEPNLSRHAVVGFLHGFSIRFGMVKPPASTGVVMVAPKGPGRTLRDRFVAGQGIPCLFAVHAGGIDAKQTRSLGLAWANGIGSLRAAVIETTFAAEAETDLFGEQSVLCGGMLALVKAAYQTLVEAGYPPMLAYIECCHELKQVADLMYARGPSGMRDAISTTAEFGAFDAEGVLLTDKLRQDFKSILARVRDGSFARRFQGDADGGFPIMKKLQQAAAHDPMEEAGRKVRALIPWLAKETP
ncbi:MAG: ketol-acid reductoisomerase [Planctomycetes bacterium]|nr:ketol-acid reductoisomerase [Planctomycetota bacterium]